MKNNKGFSLVELIVVIAIMAILAAVAVVSFSIYIRKSNEAADLDYRTKLEYAAQLVAADRQFDLVDVHCNGVVKGPQDIWLTVQGSSGEVEYNYDTHPDILQAIYDIVGGWTFSDACDHAAGEKVITAATCQSTGLIQYTCCDAKEIIPIDLTNGHAWTKEKEDKGSTYYICLREHSYVDRNGVTRTTTCNYSKIESGGVVVSITPPSEP